MHLKYAEMLAIVVHENTSKTPTVSLNFIRLLRVVDKATRSNRMNFRLSHRSQIDLT